MNNQIIIYGKHPTTGNITPINVTGNGQNATIGYNSTLQGGDDFGNVPNPRVNGEQLFYNTTTQKYDSRIRDYFCCNISGAIIATAANTFYHLALASGTGEAYSNVTIYRTSNSSSGITWSGTSISGFSSSKIYNIYGNLSMSSLNISTADTIYSFTLWINGSEVKRSQLTFNSDGSFGSNLSLYHIASGVSSVQFRVSTNFATATPQSGATNPSIIFNCCITEI